jgi:hypothetical protein
MPRRKRLLPTASAEKFPSDFSIKDDDWLAVERACGCSFPRKTRDEMQKVTRDFIYWASAETRAELLSTAQECILAWKGAADDFDRALYGQPESDARSYARHLVTKYFIDRRFRRTDLFQDLSGVLSDFIGACSHALNEDGASEDRGFRQGESWERWVRDLTKVLKENGFPTAVRTDDLGDKSRFTWLVVSLQELVPAKVRRLCATRLAAGKAIQRARQARDK